MFVWRAAVLATCLVLSAITWAPMGVYRDDAVGEPGHRLSGAHTVRLADAAQAEATGELIALYPRAVDAQTLAIPGGEPLENLHLSLVDFGKDVGDSSDVELKQRLDALTAAPTHPIEAQVFGHAVLNPDLGPSDAAVVYMVGDSTHLVSLRHQVLQFSEQGFQLPAQHEPWVAHITASYGLSDIFLTYTGPVIFDRIGLSWRGHIDYFPLGPR
jgi:hypothetical protein